MSRRVLFIALAVGSLAAACAAPPAAETSFGSGKRFVAEVPDFLDNVGVDPSVVVTADGVPYVAYLAFLESLAKGEIAPIRPIGAPSLPSVELASLSGGVWTRGAVAMQAAIPNVSVAFGPADVMDVKNLTADNATGLDMAVDKSGHLSVVWSSAPGLWYANDTSGSFQATQIVGGVGTPAPGSVSGPSVALDASGTPWVSYYAGDAVYAGSLQGSTWKVEEVSAAKGCATCRTAIGMRKDGTPIVAFAGGGRPWVATPAGKKWASQTIGTGPGGQGMAMAVDKDGNPHFSYYAGTEVVEARSIGGGPWQTTKVASVSEGSPDAAGAATSIAIDDQGHSYVAWYDAGSDSVGLASNEAGTFAPIPVTDTLEGNSPSVAVTGDGSFVYLAWYERVNQNLDFGTFGDVTGLALAQPSPTPTAAPTTAPSAPPAACAPTGASLQITAQGIAFSTNCLAAPANTPFTIAFDNKDSGVPHNVAIFTDSSATTNLFTGAIVTGPATATYKVGALKPGNYFFRCDVHPTVMFGTFIVK